MESGNGVMRPQNQWFPAAAASAIQVNIMCDSVGAFNTECFQQIAESAFSKLLKP